MTACPDCAAWTERQPRHLALRLQRVLGTPPSTNYLLELIVRATRNTKCEGSHADTP